MDPREPFRPPLLASCLLALLASAASLLLVLADPLPVPEAVVYAVYAAAALGLGLAAWAIVLAWKKASPSDRLRRWAAKRPWTDRLARDPAFRIVAANYLSFAAALTFAILRTVMGAALHSTWFGVLAGYSILLCAARVLLIRSSRRRARLQAARDRAIYDWRAYRLCGVLIALTALFLQGAVLHMVYTSQGYHYDGMLIYVVALYDFWTLISSLVYMLRHAGRQNPLVRAIKSLGLAGSLASILALQSAMFASFGSETQVSTQRLINALTGTAVCLILIGMGGAIFFRAGRQLRALDDRG